MLKRFRWTSAAALLACMAGTAGAQGAVITNGTIRMGINALAQLNFGSAPQITGTTVVGLRLITAAGDYESTADGCECEGWGVGTRVGGVVTVSGYANDAVGTANLTGESFTSTASTATSTVRLTAGASLRVTHTYKPSAVPNLYEVEVKITNFGATSISDVVYRRVMDWDISPTQFNENVRISGWPAANLIGSGSNGFLSAQPLDLAGGCTIGGVCNGNFETTTGDDRGSFFDFSFGALGAGESRTFTTFYGAAPTLDGLLSALGSVGAEIYTAAWCAGTGGTGATKCNGKAGPAVFGYGFKGVGGTVPPELGGTVPEPSTYALMATGLIGLVGISRRRRTS
jgi:PEP-CTERM motif